MDQELRDRCIQDQLSELMLLNSMYKVPEELQFATNDGNFQSDMVDELLAVSTDNTSPTAKKCFMDEFSLKLKDLADDVEIDLTFRLSPRYPHAEPLSVYVRCSSLDSQQSCQINATLRQYINESLPLGEPQVIDAVSWLRDNLHQFLLASRKTKIINDDNEKISNQFQRLWFYSHHIFSKFKRKDILTLAAELDLSGFSMPGKPGVICIEGSQESCQTFWNTIRTWSWKRLIMRHQETIDNVEDLNKLRKFGEMKEISFDVRRGGGREYHMDMGGFSKYLTEHDCASAFWVLFGLESAD